MICLFSTSDHIFHGLPRGLFHSGLIARTAPTVPVSASHSRYNMSRPAFCLKILFESSRENLFFFSNPWKYDVRLFHYTRFHFVANAAHYGFTVPGYKCIRFAGKYFFIFIKTRRIVQPHNSKIAGRGKFYNDSVGVPVAKRSQMKYFNVLWNSFAPGIRPPVFNNNNNNNLIYAKFNYKYVWICFVCAL